MLINTLISTTNLGMCWSQHIPKLVVLGILFLGNGINLKAQNTADQDMMLEREIARAEALLYSHTDSTIVLTDRILKILKTRHQVDTPFGIQVRLTQASAFLINRQDALILEKLMRLEQLSRERGLWKSHARTCLELAVMYETNMFKDRSRQQLDLAKADINRHRLNDVYPRFAVRMASWQRIFNDTDSAMFFAREAVRTAPKYGLIPDEADGNFLIGVLLPKSLYEERLRSALRATSLYQKIGNKDMVINMLGTITRIHLGAKAFSMALKYCDSVAVETDQLIAQGKEKKRGFGVKATQYRTRGDIYQQMGRLDSALANTIRSYELELKEQNLEERDKIHEIDTRYRSQLNQRQITEQQLAIHLKHNQLRFAVIIVVLFGGSAVGLLLAYRKQRQDKQKLLEQNVLIQQQSTQLKQLDVAKSRFFANVSHELRTPLTLLLGPVGTLLTENHLTDKQSGLLHLVLRNSKQLEQLVTDILDLGKLELGKMELNEKPILLAPFFRSHLAQFESLALNRNLHYSFELNVADDVVVKLDQSKYRQILNNLLGNAFKFTPFGGIITAKLTLTGGKLYLLVSDNGSGIHPDDMPHLFDRYFQTSRPDKPAEGGTGIGLALCREYIGLMGGTIDVQSTLGAGSVFRLTFPVITISIDVQLQETPEAHLEMSGAEMAPPVVTMAEIKPAVSSTTARPTILVVEDNLDLQAYIRLLLSDKYKVLTAENGQVALERLKCEGQSRISIVISDIMMPIMDGHQFLEAIKSDDATRHIPVIMLTARADAPDKLRALRIGVDDYLLKPFDEEELLARIDNLLINQAARLEAVAKEKVDPTSYLMSTTDRKWLETFEGYVQQHLADPTTTIPELARHFAMSESTLLRQLKRLIGLSPLQYVQAVQLEEARRLLESRTYNSIAQVAAKVGYADARTFARSFRTRFGKLPSELLAIKSSGKRNS